MRAELIDKISRLPRMCSALGRAWMIDESKINAAVNRDADHAGIGASWLIEAPWAHPAWHSYFLTAMHLRPIRGMDPPFILLDGATHEVALYALDPRRPRDGFADSREAAVFLTPANFHGQWHADSDQHARDHIYECVLDILRGKLSPDTDFRSQWVDRFSDSNIKAESVGGVA